MVGIPRSRHSCPRTLSCILLAKQPMPLRMLQACWCAVNWRVVTLPPLHMPTCPSRVEKSTISSLCPWTMQRCLGASGGVCAATSSYIGTNCTLFCLFGLRLLVFLLAISSPYFVCIGSERHPVFIHLVLQVFPVLKLTEFHLLSTPIWCWHNTSGPSSPWGLHPGAAFFSLFYLGMVVRKKSRSKSIFCFFFDPFWSFFFFFFITHV